MENSGIGAFVGADSEGNATFAGVAATNAFLAPARLQPNVLGDVPSAAIAQLAGPLAFAAATLAAAPVQVGSAVADLDCQHPSDSGGPSQQPEQLRSAPSLEQIPALEQTSWRPHSELLPPARLVEVAHAALQSSGFRRRQMPVAQQPPVQGGQYGNSERSAATSMESERSAALKREVRQWDGDGHGDPDRQHDLKRPRAAACAEVGLPDAPVPPSSDAGAADAVARIASGGTSVSQQALLQPFITAKRETWSLPLAAVGSGTSPFARPQPGRFSVNGGPDGIVVPSADTAQPAQNGPMKSAFSHAASLPTEWQPGCSVTTGRRSARSPAIKGSRNLGLTRATSADVNSSPVSRRGSGFGAAPSAFAQVEANSQNANAGSGGPSAATATVAAATAVAAGEPDNGNVAANGGARSANGAPETAASADLRRLAQLAEAAAMLEGQLTTVGGGSTKGARRAAGNGPDADSSQVAANGRTGAIDDGGKAGAEGAEQATLRNRAGSLTAAGLGTDSATGSGGSGSAACGAGTGAREPGPYQGLPAISIPTSMRAFGSQPARVAESPRGRMGGREGTPDDGDEEGAVGSHHRRCQHDSEAISGGGSQDGEGHRGDDDDDDGDMGDDMGDGSNDSAGGGSSGGGSGGRTMTERYRAALKASAAQQRGRGAGGSSGSPRNDSDKASSRGANRNGVCARIASITKERLQLVYHLNIEEAARELGIGMTKLKEHCRTLGIPRWPSRKLKSMDKLIESLNERAMTEPATKEVIADILEEIESFKRAIYENPCLEVEEDIKRLRQSNFKKEYQQRQVENRHRVGPNDRLMGGGGSGRASSAGGSQQQQGGLREVASGPMSAVSILPGAGSAAVLSQPTMAGNISSALTASLGPAFVTGHLSGGLSGQGSSQLAQALSQVQAQQLPGQMSLLAQGHLQQLLMGQPPTTLQQLMAQRALGGMPSPGMLLPSALSQQLQQQQVAKPLGALAAVGESAPDND